MPFDYIRANTNRKKNEYDKTQQMAERNKNNKSAFAFNFSNNTSTKILLHANYCHI